MFGAISQDAAVAKGPSAASGSGIAKGKDLSRLPVQQPGSVSHGIGEDAEVPSDGRGFDPVPTNSSDGSARLPVARSVGNSDAPKPQHPPGAGDGAKEGSGN